MERYFCDKCKKEVKSRYSDLMPIELKYGRRKGGEFGDYPHSKSIEVCFDCADELGFDTTLAREMDNKNPYIADERTKGDKLYDFVRDIVTEVMQGVQE